MADEVKKTVKVLGGAGVGADTFYANCAAARAAGSPRFAPATPATAPTSTATATASVAKAR